MFERFTAAARAVVGGAVEHADRTGSDCVGEPELLLALLDQRDSPAAAVLDGLGAPRPAVVRDLAADRRRGGLSAADTAALAGLGIDVDAVVARVEETHGAGALAGGGRRAGRGKRVRRTFAPEGKAVLERALRIAAGRGDRRLGDEHLLLALTAGSGPAGVVLAGHGVTYDAVARVLAEPSARRAS
ncbi:Clp protease N-terminal domain-containing protein [Streptomyces noursei]|uniref:Clp protease N-terminal domain-containing protein n=1 Tax=Streptomyces noursei TaxID=1971 RepID=UPI0016744460|nr:Clp protease N-terminal domain-containing protein [Streptomyces noursei]MCZ1018006.1 Clp protease N-terminal domain-containing protein [Streptomyces noursei]GGW85963.1 peptidase [Streptomyces noursei]